MLMSETRDGPNRDRASVDWFLLDVNRMSLPCHGYLY